MSKKFRAGRRKAQISPNNFSSKRRSKSIRKVLYAPALQPSLFYEEPICSMCGKELIGEGYNQDGKTFCSFCLMVWNG